MYGFFSRSICGYCRIDVLVLRLLLLFELSLKPVIVLGNPGLDLILLLGRCANV